MTANELRRLAVPAVLAAAILVSFRFRAHGDGLPAPAPVALAGEEPPLPSDADVRAAFAMALAPGAPGYDRGATGAGARAGAGATVTVLEFADFGCQYCARFASETWPRLDAEFVKTGRVRWRYVPFVLGMFANGDQAARAGECAAVQGRAPFGRMHDLLFRRQDEWQSAGDPSATFRSMAAAAHLDVARFAACYASDAPTMRIRASNALADRMGVRATPTFFVNGARVEGALPAAQFEALLQDALRQARSTGEQEGVGGGE